MCTINYKIARERDDERKMCSAIDNNQKAIDIARTLSSLIYIRPPEHERVLLAPNEAVLHMHHRLVTEFISHACVTNA